MAVALVLVQWGARSVVSEANSPTCVATAESLASKSYHGPPPVPASLQIGDEYYCDSGGSGGEMICHRESRVFWDVLADCQQS